MTAGWVAAATRGRALTRRLVGAAGARDMAARSWPEARAVLAGTFYGTDLPSDASRTIAGRQVVEATTWQLRVLAGWLPPGQGVLARLFAGPVEIANIEGRLAQLDGSRAGAPFRLGSLAVAWPRVATAGSAEQVRGALATSVWGDPGSTDRTRIALSLRVAWARRLTHRVPDAATWATGATTVLVARERFAFDRTVADPVDHIVDGLLGRHWREAADLPSLRDRLPRSASWPLQDVEDPADLWRAEIAVGRRVSEDARRRLDTGRYDRSTVTGVMALMLVDLWRVRGAIELAGRAPIPEELFDAVA